MGPPRNPRNPRHWRPTRAVAALAVAAIALAGCSGAVASPSPAYTAVLIGPTAWPSGTTGQYGLRIDPSLLDKVPRSVRALPLTEDAASEAIALQDADLANTLDRYTAASVAKIGDPDWLAVSISHFKADGPTADVYTAWVQQYADGACSQAGGVSRTTQETIGDKIVDVATCNGGLTVYTLPLGGGVVLSMYEFGPRQIGRQLIAALN